MIPHPYAHAAQLEPKLWRRPEWAEYKPHAQDGEKQPVYKHRVGHVLHFSKVASSSRQIRYPGEFAAEGQAIVAAAGAFNPTPQPSTSQTTSDEPMPMPIPAPESSDAEGSPPQFLPPAMEQDWQLGSLSSWCAL